jgi:uncharacterized protein YndB with AHSA1/START domain
MTLTLDPAVRAITVEETVPHAADVVWKVLTTPELIERWLMRNDFTSGLGQRFTLQSRPMGDWDGTVKCAITTWDPPRELAYTWVGGSTANGGKHGSALDSVVTWTLTPVPHGTRVRMVHDGFRSPQNDAGYDAMSGGWKTVLPRIAQIAGELA